MRAGFAVRLAAVLSLALAASALASHAAAPDGGAPVPGEGPLHFRSYRFALPGKVKFALYEDVNGDSLVDVVAVYGGSRADDPSRNLVVFLQRKDGFSLEPDIRYRVPEDVAVIDVADVIAESPGDELLMLDAHGVSWLPLGAPPPDSTREAAAGTRLIETPSVYAHADPVTLARRPFALRRKGEKLATILIPVTGGYRVFYPADHYAVPDSFEMPHLHEVTRDSYAVHISEASFADVNGDGADDLVLAYLDQLRVYFADGGRFHARPDVDLALGIITREDRDSPAGLAHLMGFQVKDLDGDSLADLFVWKRVIAKKAVINDKQQYQIYRNRGGRFDRVPDQAFILRSLESEPKLRDLNGDGRPDLVTGTMDFSIGNLVKVLVTGRLNLDMDFFLGRPGGFPDEPDETRSIRIKVSVSNLDEFFVPAVETDGDYDGDGVNDFLIQTADEEVAIYRGRHGGGGLYEKEPFVRLKTPAASGDVVKDMNGDGRDDIAFDHFADRKPFDPGWIVVLLSQAK